MPPIEGGTKMKKETLPQSWADQMENDDDYVLPPASEIIQDGNKIVTQYEVDEDGVRRKFVRYYKIEKIKVSKSIAVRKGWKKYGKAGNDGPGPNPSNTVIQDEIQMNFPTRDNEKGNDDPGNMKKLGSFVKCRYCDQDHWSTSCPYKDKLALKMTDKEQALAAAGAVGPGAAAEKAGNFSVLGDGKSKYVPPSMRDGGNRKGEMLSTSRTKDEANTIRVTNLPEDIQDADIRDLFSGFGRISRIFLARDKYTGQSKGFAFVSFERREDATRAVNTVNGHGYANLILNVEWAKPSNN